MTPQRPSDDASIEDWKAYARELEDALNQTVRPVRAAEGMAAAIDWYVHTNLLNPRSVPADVRLGYGEPFDRETCLKILAKHLPTFRDQ